MLSRVYSPLRTSVELFRDPHSVEAVTRAKQAAVLYDELLFESGIYEISISEEGSFEFHRPPGMFTDEDLVRSRELPEPGAGFAFSIGAETVPGEPAPPEAMHTIVAGPLSVHYVAEFETGILRELRQLNVPWVAEGGFDSQALAQSGYSQVISRFSREVKADKSWALPNTFHRSFVAKSFARDAVLAARLGAAFSPTSLFEPAVRSSGAHAVHAGERALSMLVPNLSGLPWEQIAEFREHPGSIEARQKLADIDRRVSELPPDEPLDAMSALFHEVTSDLLSAVREMQGKTASDVAREVAKTAIGLIPIVGQFAGAAASLAHLAARERFERRHWTAALMRLRDPS